mmetsp:Transcript_26723/g.56449  ORF Transcript_26723/g.56449 Transcript_26723/m.56449 type:complete len:437 (+) Transcript_26723:239-1549(+)
MHPINLPHNIPRQRFALGKKVQTLFQLLHARMSHQCRGNQTALSGPSQGKFGERHSRPLGNFGIFLNGILCRGRAISVEGVAPSKLVHAPARMAQLFHNVGAFGQVQCGGLIHVFSREHSSREGVVGHEADVFVVRRGGLGDSIFFRFAIDERKVPLEIAGWCDAQGFGGAGASRESVGVIVAQSPTTDLTLVNQLLHGETEILKGCRAAHAPPIGRFVRFDIVRQGLSPVGLGRIPRRPMKLIHINIIHSQSLQTSITILLNIFRIDIPTPRDFGGNHHFGTTLALVKITALHPFANGLFRISLKGSFVIGGDGILFGRVDEVDTRFEDGLVHELKDLILVGGVEIGRYPALRPQSQLANNNITSAQPPLSHPIDALDDLVRRSFVGVDILASSFGSIGHLIKSRETIRTAIVVIAKESREEPPGHHIDGLATSW